MIPRTPEPELMDLPDEVDAYARADFSAVNAKFIARLLELAGDRPHTLVDLGCGPGDITAEIARQRPTWNVVGVDASAPMIQLARTRALSNLRFDCSDFRTWNPESTAVSMIVSNSLLHHIPSPADFWHAIASLAAPGTIVFIRDLFRPDSAESARAIVDQNAGTESALLQEEFYRSLLAAHTPAEIRQQLDRAGLRSLQVAPVSDRHVDVWGVV
jgi:trans-aconitate methyltransferase